MAAHEGVKPLKERPGRPDGNVSQINIRPTGTPAAYLVRRLKRDHPGIAAALGRHRLGIPPHDAARSHKRG
jgi:hypothetical protein